MIDYLCFNVQILALTQSSYGDYLSVVMGKPIVTSSYEFCRLSVYLL